MATNYPTSADDSTSLPDPTATSKTNSPSHSSLHANANGAIKALEAKLGTGASTPVANRLLFGNGTGTSAWSQLSSAQLAASLSDETGSGSAVFATTPTLVTPKVDTINESTPANGVTIDGLNIKDNKLNTNDSVVTANVTDSAITPAKLQSGAGTSWVMQTYTPAWTAATTNPAIGNGTLTGRYMQTGKMVDLEIFLKAGSTTTFGSGNWFFALPVTATNNYFTGTAFILDSGTSFFGMNILNATDVTIASPSTTKIFGASFTVGTTLGATVPMTWTTSDQLTINYRFEAA